MNGETCLRRLAESLTVDQIMAMLGEGDGVMDDFVCHADPTGGQIDLIIPLLEAEPRVLRSDPATVAYHLIASRHCSPAQLERLAGWCDDIGTWRMLVEQYPGGEPELCRIAGEWTSIRYAREIPENLMLEWAERIVRADDRHAAIRMMYRHDAPERAIRMFNEKGWKRRAW